MKLRKQIKNRVMAVAMLAVVLFCVFICQPDGFVFANNIKSVEITELNDDGTVQTDNKGNDKHTVYSLQPLGISSCTMLFIYANEGKNNDLDVIFLSKEPFDSVKVSKLADGGSVVNYYWKAGGTTAQGLSTYYYIYSGFYGGTNLYKFSGFTKNTSITERNSHGNQAAYIKYYVDNYLNYGDEWTDGAYSIDEFTREGSQDNPILDSDIGTLVLKKSKCYWVGDGSMDVSQRVQWANKTDTDFSLTNNKYAITRIEVKIGNRVTYFGDVEHHGKGKKVDNFGEVYPFKYVIATDNPHDFSFKDMLSASKTDLTKYNAAMLEHEYDLYFRVVCGTAYGTSAEWHCGNWTRYRVTDDPKQDGKNESDNGHFNDNGEWEKDKDTDVDSGGIGNVDDKDDLEDDFNHFKDSENWKDWLNKEGLDLDSAKAFIGQVADVPKMIGDLFSFFPDWVKYSFAFGFGLIPVIIVIKFLRG